jgi:hypothetical protein
MCILSLKLHKLIKYDETLSHTLTDRILEMKHDKNICIKNLFFF